MPLGRGQDYSDKGEAREVTRLAREVFGIKLGKGLETGVQANFIGVRSDVVSLSSRIDSRTYFIQDSRYGPERKAGVFGGTDREYIRAGRDLLKRLRIPSSEIASAEVLAEQTQVAFVDRERKTVELEKPQQGKSMLRVTRQIEKLPVWSSTMLLGLTEDGNIGFLQLHWPEIPSQVIAEAQRLNYMVRHKWEAAEQPGAAVEKIEAGIIHSPAVGLLMDIYPVIRVIYRDREDRLGRKGVAYLDRSGKPVPIPRQAEWRIEPPQQRVSPERKESP